MIVEFIDYSFTINQVILTNNSREPMPERERQVKGTRSGRTIGKAAGRNAL